MVLRGSYRRTHLARFDRRDCLALCRRVFLGTGQGSQILAAVGHVRVAEFVAEWFGDAVGYGDVLVMAGFLLRSTGF